MVPVLSTFCYEGQDHSVGKGAAFTNNRKKLFILQDNRKKY